MCASVCPGLCLCGMMLGKISLVSLVGSLVGPWVFALLLAIMTLGGSRTGVLSLGCKDGESAKLLRASRNFFPSQVLSSPGLLGSSRSCAGCVGVKLVVKRGSAGGGPSFGVATYLGAQLTGRAARQTDSGERSTSFTGTPFVRLPNAGCQRGVKENIPF